jgi:hypothetical protein
MSSELPLRRADALVAEGRYLDAIDALSEANRVERSAAIEERLVVLRRQAFSEVRDSKGRDTWPPKFEDPFDGVDGAVEIPADELSVEKLGGAIQHHGCLVVRGLMPRPTVDRLVDAIERALQAQEASHNGAPVSETTPWFAPHPDYPVTPRTIDKNRVFLADSPRAMFEVAEAFRETGIDSLAAEYLGDRPVMTDKKWMLWRMDRSADVFTFHQEASVFNAGPVRTVNICVALSECGVTSPGFQFYPCRMDQIAEPDPNELYRFALDPETIARISGDTAVAAPLYDAGDAVLFDEYLLHRTKSSNEMSDVRYSVESWMFAPCGHPRRDTQGPIVL